MPSAAPTVAQSRRTHVLLHAAERIAAKTKRREELIGGKRHDYTLEIRGTVDDCEVEPLRFSGGVSVDHDRECVRGDACDTEHLVAFFLSKLGAAGRMKAFDELTTTFAEQKQLPAVDAALLEQAEQLLKQLRATKTIHQKGNVNVTFSGA